MFFDAEFKSKSVPTSFDSKAAVAAVIKPPARRVERMAKLGVHTVVIAVATENR